MITKARKGDLGPGLPEKKKKKKKKKKKVIKEPETQYSLLNSDNYFTPVFPIRATTPSESVGHGQVPEMPLVKKKKKKKGCDEPLEQDSPAPAHRLKSTSPRRQVLGASELLSGDKKKKRKSLWPLATPPDAGLETSLDPREGGEATRAGRKLKKHKKEKKAQEPESCSAKHSWLYEAGDAAWPCSREREGQERAAALGQKRKQGSPREHSMKVNKKKKICQWGEPVSGHSKLPKSVESSPRKGGGKKKSAKTETPEYIPIGDGPRISVKKKVKTKKKAELPGVEPALKKKKKKKKENSVVEKPQEEEEEPDTDLEVVLEKKGNMDEAHIDQVRRKALQEEIDRESGKTESSESRKWTGTQFGQWDTAGFESEEKKLKFLKLMGGFKNLSPSLSRPSAVGRPNMALGKKAADTLQQSLQRDYDRAVSWKHSRGAGLGFSSTPDKVFYIDRNASKSIKFED